MEVGGFEWENGGRSVGFGGSGRVVEYIDYSIVSRGVSKSSIRIKLDYLLIPFKKLIPL